jgi:hypothetical protein
MMNIAVLEGLYAICRLDPGSEYPDWAVDSEFLSITRSDAELSLVCRQENVVSPVRSSRDWRVLMVEGPLDLQMKGVLSGLLGPLSRESISVFVVSTFDTDYLLVQDRDLNRTAAVLQEEGHGFGFPPHEEK